MRINLMARYLGGTLLTAFVAMAFVAFWLPGCGNLADSDRIPIAEMQGKTIRRADLNELLRSMLNEERPLIRTRGDLLRVLNDDIDNKLKSAAGEKLVAAGKIQVNREMAASRFDAMFPDYRAMYERGAEMDMGAADKNYIKAQRELKIDEMQARLTGDMAVAFLAQEAYENKTITISDEEFAHEYEYRKDQLLFPATATFRGIFFPITPTAAQIATSARERIEAGEDLNALASEYSAAQLGQPLESTLPEDPRMGQKFASFWEQASGAAVGAVIGPLFIRGWEAARPGADGQPVRITLPDAFLVCRITAAAPVKPKTLEESKNDLVPVIMNTRIIAKLREEAGVKIHEDNLPDPSITEEGSPRSIFEVEAARQRELQRQHQPSMQ